MAKFNLNMPDDLLKGATAAVSPENMQRAIDSATPILEKSMQKEVQGAVRHSGGSDLVKSIRANKAKKAKNGAYIATVYPHGKSKAPRYPNGSRKDRIPPVSNAMKAAILNYGKKGQPARPWLTKAVNNVRTQVEEQLEKAFEEKLDDNG